MRPISGTSVLVLERWEFEFNGSREEEDRESLRQLGSMSSWWSAEEAGDTAGKQEHDPWLEFQQSIGNLNGSFSSSTTPIFWRLASVQAFFFS